VAKNPIEELEETKEKLAAQRKAHELSLWQQWQDHGKQPEHLQPLLKLYEPVVAQKVRMWKPPAIPASAYAAELNTHLIRSFEKYDPSRGAALNTHAENYLKKALRYGNRHANLAHIPEGQAQYIGKIDKASDHLKDELGRAPTPAEIGHQVGISAKLVSRIQGSRVRDIPASAFETDPTERVPSYEEQQIAVAQQELHKLFPKSPAMHTLFHHTFGTNGHEQIHSTGVLAKKMGRSVSQISRMKTEMGNTLKSYMGPGNGNDD